MYFKEKGKTEMAMKKGRSVPGGLGVLDKDRYTSVDRKKDIARTGGENVASREVKEATSLYVR